MLVLRGLTKCMKQISFTSQIIPPPPYFSLISIQICSNEVSLNEMPMTLMSPHAFYHKNVDLHFLSKIEFSLEWRKIFAWFFGILLYSLSLKNERHFLKFCWNFCINEAYEVTVFCLSNYFPLLSLSYPMKFLELKSQSF